MLGRVLEKALLKISQKLKKNTCARVSWANTSIFNILFSKLYLHLLSLFLIYMFLIKRRWLSFTYQELCRYHINVIAIVKFSKVYSIISYKIEKLTVEGVHLMKTPENDLWKKFKLISSEVARCQFASWKKLFHTFSMYFAFVFSERITIAFSKVVLTVGEVCNSEDIIVLVCHVKLQHHVIKGPCDFMGRSPSS